MTKEDFVTASALATYVFCPYAWWLSRKYGVIETKAMREGNYLHSPLILTLTERALEERGYGKPIYCGHKSHYPTLYSKNYKLIGRPDYIMSTGKVLVPVELKSSPAPENPYFSHIMQLIAYCVLTEENYKLPEYGLVIYRSGEPVRVEYLRFKHRCIELIQAMQKSLKTNTIPSPQPSKKCKACSQKDRCLTKSL